MKSVKRWLPSALIVLFIPVAVFGVLHPPAEGTVLYAVCVTATASAGIAVLVIMLTFALFAIYMIMS